MRKITLDLIKTSETPDIPLTLVAAVRNAIERGFTVADLVMNLTDRGYDMVLVPKGSKNGIPVPVSPQELVQRIQKHQAGTHDQTTHGRWASEALEIPQSGFVNQENNLVSSKAPHLGLSEISKKTRLRIADVKLISQDDDGANFSSTYTAKDGKKINMTWKETYKSEPSVFHGYTVSGEAIAQVGDQDVGRLKYNSVGHSLYPYDKYPTHVSRIAHVGVKSEFHKLGIATALLEFSRMKSKTAVLHSGQLTPEGKAWAEIVKHQSGTHDQSSHGNWADKLSGTRTGDNRLTLYDSLQLQKGQSDPQQNKVYTAQSDAFPYNEVPKPFFKNNRGEYASTKEYDDAYKKYSKEFLDWQRATTINIESPIAKKHLNGTPKGVKNYVNEVITQDWFVESFGKAAFFPTLEVKVNDAVKTAGSYFRQYNTGTEASRHGISVYRGFTQDERLMLHEIAHYATAISATKVNQPHGREWAGNFLYILQNTMGEKIADTLRKEFDKKGVIYTND